MQIFYQKIYKLKEQFLQISSVNLGQLQIQEGGDRALKFTHPNQFSISTITNRVENKIIGSDTLNFSIHYTNLQ